MDDQYWMQQAIQMAMQAQAMQEVPVGAVITVNNECIAQAYNAPIHNHDPTAHAEMLALRVAGKKLNNYRMIDATMYVTLEPCVMCAMALVHARIKRLVFAAFDPKTGGITSTLDLFSQSFINHRFDYEGGILATEAKKLLQDFFKARR